MTGGEPLMCCYIGCGKPATFGAIAENAPPSPDNRGETHACDDHLVEIGLTHLADHPPAHHWRVWTIAAALIVLLAACEAAAPASAPPTLQPVDAAACPAITALCVNLACTSRTCQGETCRCTLAYPLPTVPSVEVLCMAPPYCEFPCNGVRVLCSGACYCLPADVPPVCP